MKLCHFAVTGNNLLSLGSHLFGYLVNVSMNGELPFPESNCAIVCVPELPVNSSLGSSAVSFALTCILGTYSAHKFWQDPSMATLSCAPKLDLP